MWQNFVLWIEQHQASCMYRKYLGIRCFGCGLQTSILELLKGNVLQSIKEYPALIPLIFTFIFLILFIIKKGKKFRKLLLYTFYTTLFIIVFNYIIHLLTN